ncbi:MAG: adenylate/guanylate cyclase domain-containing protein [Hyphomicrobiales bacterium]|nr:adenylate/guanylate cyclase domain-containing protein [Hyphomicrobiales bacterium]
MPEARPLPHPIIKFDDALGRRIVNTHIWAVREGLRGAAAEALFDGYCQRLVADGVPLWRSQTAMETLHPQWSGYGYTWRRDLNAIQPMQFEHNVEADPMWIQSPFFELIRRAKAGDDEPSLRRRLSEGPAQRDFPVLEEFFSLGATDYLCRLYSFGEAGDPSQGTGVVYSFTSDRRDGFSESDLTLIDATLPALSLAMKSDAGHVIASSLLGAYLGADAGRRVHSGAVQRGSVSSIRAALWYADIRGFTATSDAAPGATIVALLNDVFETLTAPLRSRGGQVLKFIGDAVLATFPLEEGDVAETCVRALDAAHEAARGLAALNATRATAGLPAAEVDIALHVGEVLYGNVGAIDRLDFTVIGPAVNEVTRIEALCEPLGRRVVVSADFVAAMGDDARLESLGRHVLRGVREPKSIFALPVAAGA